MDLLETIKVLKLGVTKEDYPYFGQFINFSDKIRSCNGSVYVEFSDNPFPIEGDINAFSFEEVLRNCSSPQIEQNDYKLHISDGNFKTDLLIDDIDFPHHSELKIRYLELDEDFLYQLKTALKFTGEGLFKYAYINKDYILSSANKKKMFYYKHDKKVKGVIGINSKILSVLDKGISVGTLEDNTVVKFNEGRIIFKIALLDTYPSEDTVKAFEEKPDVKELCNVAVLQDAVKKVSSVLVNEKLKRVKLYNKDNKLEVKAESEICGISELEIESSLEDEWESEINFNDLSNIDMDYDVFVCNENNYLYFSNEKSEIIVAGVNNGT